MTLSNFIVILLLLLYMKCWFLCFLNITPWRCILLTSSNIFYLSAQNTIISYLIYHPYLHLFFPSCISLSHFPLRLYVINWQFYKSYSTLTLLIKLKISRIWGSKRPQEGPRLRLNPQCFYLCFLPITV